MYKDHSNKNLQKASFKNLDLVNAVFVNSDLRGADFSGADLTRADFTNTKTGITPVTTVLLFFIALIVSMVSGFVSMLAGQTIHKNTRLANAKFFGSKIRNADFSDADVSFVYWGDSKKSNCIINN
jgi:uncharacterized protein YjbI with pentapeptide repeats